MAVAESMEYSNKKHVRSRLVEATSKLPLVGRHLIRLAYIQGRNGAREGDYSRKYGAITFLGLVSLFHINNMRVGIDATAHNIEQKDAMDTVEAGYDSMYVAVNGLVAYTQVYLLGKVGLTKHNPSVAPSDLTEADILLGNNSHSGDPKTDSFTSKNAPMDLFVTFAGQLLFFATR